MNQKNNIMLMKKEKLKTQLENVLTQVKMNSKLSKDNREGTILIVSEAIHELELPNKIRN